MREAKDLRARDDVPLELPSLESPKHQNSYSVTKPFGIELSDFPQSTQDLFRSERRGVEPYPNSIIDSIGNGSQDG